MLGHELKNTLRGAGYEVICVARKNSDYNIDITKDEKLLKVMDYANPDIVINSAAVVDVNCCETNETEVYRLNSRVPGILAMKCAEKGAYLVQISTDHFYTGDGRRKHCETDSVKLVNGYARTKYCGEQLALTYDNTIVIRTNIIGIGGSSRRKTFLEWVFEEIRMNREMELFDDFFTSSIHVCELSRIIVKILRQDMLKGIYNIASADVFSKKEFILNVSESIFGHEPKYCTKSVKNIDGVKRAESLGLNTKKIEKITGISMPSLQDTIRTIKEEFERRMM